MDATLEQEYRQSAGVEIRRLRRMHKLSAHGLARAAGRDHAIISRVERGMATASRNLIEQIIAGLELSEYRANRLRLAAGYAPRKAVSDAHEV